MTNGDWLAGTAGKIFALTSDVISQSTTFAKFAIEGAEAYEDMKLREAFSVMGDYLNNDIEIPTKILSDIRNRLEGNDALIEVVLRFKESVRKSYSIETAKLLGIYLGKIITSKKTLEKEQESAIIIHALSILNDYDLQHFSMAYSYLKTNNKADTPHNIFEATKKNNNDSKYKNARSLDYFQVSMNRLSGTQILVSIGGMNGSTLYRSSHLSKVLFDLINDYEELKKKSI